MGIFNFGKKKDPLEDLDLPSNSDDTQFDAHNFTDQGQPDFQHDTPQSSDSLSQVPNFSQPQSQSQPDSFSNQNHPSDPYSQYQQAVQNSPGSFHTSEQNVSSHDTSSSSRQGVDHSTELVLSKLDVLKAMIENLGHRIENLEQKYQYDKEQRKKSW